VIEEWLKLHGLRNYFVYINKSPHITDSIKPSFDIYIGDEAVSSMKTDPNTLLAVVRHMAKRPLGVDDKFRDRDFSSHAPVAFLAGTGRMYIDMFEQAWRDTWVNERGRKEIALLTICSHAKPYSKSFIHSTIRKRLHELNILHMVQYAHISTAGIIPSQAEMQYPFNAYDHDGSLMTEDAKRHFSEVTLMRIKHWLSKYGGGYDKVIFYLRGEGKTYNAAVRAVEETGINHAVVIGADMHLPKLPFVALPDVDDCLTSEVNLKKLVDTLQG
jgi:hypothetical protein